MKKINGEILVNPQPEGKPRSCSSSMRLVVHVLCVAFFADYIFRREEFVFCTMSEPSARPSGAGAAAPGQTNPKKHGKTNPIPHFLVMPAIATLGGYIVNSLDCYSSRLIGKLTTFFAASGVQLA